MRTFYFFYENLLLTGTEALVEGVVTELNTIPQILSTQTLGSPLWAKGKFVLVAQGIVNQSMAHAATPTLEPYPATPPVILNDDGVVFTKAYMLDNNKKVKRYLKVFT